MNKIFECAAVATWSVIVGAVTMYAVLYAFNIIYSPSTKIQDRMPVSRFAVIEMERHT